MTGVLNTGWLLLFQFELFPLTVPVMIALLVTLIVIHRRLWDARARLTPVSRWTIRVPFSVYLGWITVATIANIAQTLSSLGVGGFGLEAETAIAGLVLLLGLAIAATFVRRFGDVAYGAVIVWAYAGIVVKELATPIVPIVAGAGALFMIALLVLRVVIGGMGGRPAVRAPAESGGRGGHARTRPCDASHWPRRVGRRHGSVCCGRPARGRAHRLRGTRGESRHADDRDPPGDRRPAGHERHRLRLGRDRSGGR